MSHTNPTIDRVARSAAFAMMLTLASVLGAGCNYASMAGYLVMGGPKVSRQFELDKTRRTVVFVDDRGNRAPRRSLRRVMAEEAEKAILGARAMPPDMMLPTGAIMQVATEESFENPMSITELGRKVGADVVVHVSLDSFTLSADGVTYQPAASGRVRIIDAAENTRLWPLDRARGHQVIMQLPPRPGDLPRSAAAIQAAQEEAARYFGREVGRLFFEYERKDTNDPLDLW